MNRTSAALVAELIRNYPFPDPRETDGRGMVAYGGDLDPERLLSAYAQGIFPWYDTPPILWFSPDPRWVLRPNEIRITRSLAKRIRQAPYALTMDTAFEDVIEHCRKAPRPGQSGTWITADMEEAYVLLHRLGFAHSVEAWRGDELVGGLYGVSLGNAFFGESMFATAPDASKIAFARFAEQLVAWDFSFIDCQVETEHLGRFGACDWRRDDFLETLEASLRVETRRGQWSFDAH